MFNNNQNPFNNNPFGNYGVPGMTYNTNNQESALNQLLSQEEMNELKKNPQSFHTRLTRDEYLRAICTHKHPNNIYSLEKLPDGRCHCTICDATFKLIPADIDQAEVQRLCDDFYDFFQTIKTYWGNPPQSMKEFYLMSGFPKKMPYLWHVAKTYFDKMWGGNNGVLGMQGANNDNNVFQMLNNAFGYGPVGGMMPGAGVSPYYNNGMMYNPPGANGSYYNQPAQGTFMYGYNANPTAPYGAMPNAAAVQQPNPAQYMNQPPQPVQTTPAMPVPPAPNTNTTAFGTPVNNQTPAVNPVFGSNGEPTYGFNTSIYNTPAAPAAVSGATMSSPNPIGFVDQNNDFTMNANATRPQTVTTNTQVAMPGVAPVANTQPVPEPPKNPNIKDSKTASKKF